MYKLDKERILTLVAVIEENIDFIENEKITSVEILKK